MSEALNEAPPAQSHRVARRPRLDLEILVPAGIGALLIYLTAVPLGILVWDSLHVGGKVGLSLGNFEAVLRHGRTYTLLRNSFTYALGSASLALALGSAAAWLTERTAAAGRSLLRVAAIVPLLIPGVVHAIAWILLLSPRIGVANWAWGWLGIPSFDVFSMRGMIWIEAVHLSPLPFLMMAAALRRLDRTFDEAARVAGASGLSVFARVTLPLLRPVVASAFVLLVVLGLESFEVPALLSVSAHQPVLTSEIYLSVRGPFPDYGTAAAVALLLLVISGAGLVAYLRSVRNQGRFAVVTGRGRAAGDGLVQRRKLLPTVGVAFYGLVVVAMPLGMLLWTSLLPYYQVPTRVALRHLTLHNYHFVLGYPTSALAAKNSVILGAGAATAVLLISLTTAWIATHTRLRGRNVLDFITLVPLAGVPGIVLGLSLIALYARIPLPIYGTMWILLIAYVTKFMPYGMRFARGAMTALHQELDEAAKVSGASLLQRGRRILAPLILPALSALWLYVFVLGVDEFAASILLSNGKTTVISVLLYDLFESGGATTVSALAVMMVAAGCVVVGGLALASRRWDRLGGVAHGPRH